MRRLDPETFREQWSELVAAGREERPLELVPRCAQHPERPRLEVLEQVLTGALFGCPVPDCPTRVALAFEAPEEEP